MRPELAAFAEAMEETLRRNDHKGGSAAWRRKSVEELLDRLSFGARELDRAYQYHEGLEVMQRETAGVANYAMMIWDVLEQIRRRG